jgi:hypothetical protein
MSADNWNACPQCKDNKVDKVADLEKQVDGAYGKVSAEEFMRLNGLLAQAKLEVDKDDWNDRTFREDYEIYGADEGTVKVSYSGSCTKCGLRLNFEEEHMFYPKKAD